MSVMTARITDVLAQALREAVPQPRREALLIKTLNRFHQTIGKFAKVTIVKRGRDSTPQPFRITIWNLIIFAHVAGRVH